LQNFQLIVIGFSFQSDTVRLESLMTWLGCRGWILCGALWPCQM